VAKHGSFIDWIRVFKKTKTVFIEKVGHITLHMNWADTDRVRAGQARRKSG